MTPEQTQKMVDLLPSALTLGEIARSIGVGRDSLRLAAKPFLLLMDLNGTRPTCGCGVPRYTRHTCRFTQALRSRQLGHTPNADRQAKRRLVIEMLISGARYSDIDASLGMSTGSAKWFERYMSDQERLARSENIKKCDNPQDAWKGGRVERHDRNDQISAMLVSGLSVEDIAELSGASVRVVKHQLFALKSEQKVDRAANMGRGLRNQANIIQVSAQQRGA